MDMAAKSEPNTGFHNFETVPTRRSFNLNDGSNGMVCSENPSNIDKKPFISEGGNAKWSVDEEKKIGKMDMAVKSESITGFQNDGMKTGASCSNGMVYSGNSGVIDKKPFISEGDNAKWSANEEKKLEEGLAKYADEPIIMKYIKIASTLPDKTVRDVARRCKLTIIKQRKPEEQNLGKKANNRKIKQRKPEEHNLENKANNRRDKPVESTSRQHLQSALPPSMATCACIMRHMGERRHIPYDEFRLKVYEGNNISRTLEQVRADKQRVSFELEWFQSEISRLNLEIDRLRSKVTELSLCTNSLLLILRSLEAYETELLAIAGVTSHAGHSFH